ncbi:MAG: hypothetical protein AB7P01_07805 [Bacteroidia bacterium]
MAGYFTSSASYNASTHTFEFDKNNLYVKQGGTTVATHSYLNVWLAMRIYGGNFEVGSLGFNPVNSFFERLVAYSGKKAGTIYDPSTTKIIGSTDVDSGSVVKQTYNISGSTGAVKIKHNSSTSELEMVMACDPDNCTSLNPYYAQVN